MKMQINYKRHLPDTILGSKIEVTYVYSSFNDAEIDKLEEKLQAQIGAGIIADNVEMEDF